MRTGNSPRSLSGSSSLIMSGSTSRFLPRMPRAISCGPTEPYRWPSSVAFASMVTLLVRAICSASAFRSDLRASRACSTRILYRSSIRRLCSDGMIARPLGIR